MTVILQITENCRRVYITTIKGILFIKKSTSVRQEKENNENKCEKKCLIKNIMTVHANKVTLIYDLGDRMDWYTCKWGSTVVLI